MPFTSVVAGASRGLGLAYVEELASRPDSLVIGLYRSLSSAAKLLKLAQEKANAHAVQADITDPKALKSAADQISKIAGGKIDLLINNAAYQSGPIEAFKPFFEHDDSDHLTQEFTKALTTNALAAVHSTNAFLPLLRAGSTKKVLNLTTGLADADFSLKGNVTAPIYATSKAALNAINASYAVSLKDEGFIFIAISPGLVATAESAPSPEEMQVIGGMLNKFKAAAPEWDGSFATPADSVRQTLGVIENASVEQSGQFLSHLGNKQWL